MCFDTSILHEVLRNVILLLLRTSAHTKLLTMYISWTSSRRHLFYNVEMAFFIFKNCPTAFVHTFRNGQCRRLLVFSLSPVLSFNG